MPVSSSENPEAPLPAYNSQELEDCDALPDDQFSLIVISGADGKVVKKGDVSSHQVKMCCLFSFIML